MKHIRAEKTNSSGIAMGRVFIMSDRPLLCPDNYMVANEEKSLEIRKIEQAIKEVSDELETKKNKIAGDATQEILSVHQMLVNDIGFLRSITHKVAEEGENAQQAVWECCEELCRVFRASENSHMCERINDIYDIRNQILCKLKADTHNPFSAIKTPVILVADELTPSDICKINRGFVRGLITAKGSIFGHVAIMAESMGLPALVGVADMMEFVTPDSYVIMDAKAGDIIIDPDEITSLQYKEAQSVDIGQATDIRQPQFITDDRTIKIHANVGSIQEIKSALKYGVTGVGLFRTEQLYMKYSRFPTEEEQFEVYKEAALLCEDGVTIRTLDIGGDKKLDYFLVENDGDFDMKQRGIRSSLCMKERFKEQLCAILRAGAYGKVRILLPMIISQEEIRNSKEIIEICKKELAKRNVPYDDNIKIGIMIETPEAVAYAEQFAKTVDFFSIGTNDLTQYLLRTRRDNHEMMNKYDQGHPMVLAAVEQTIKAAQSVGIPFGICGELAGNPEFTQQLLAMGLEEFSMASSKISEIQKVIKTITDTSAAV